MKKYILGLELPTDPRWINVAEKNIEDILVDHAYCEQKATSSCISLIVQYPYPDLVNVLTPIVAEEWDHFSRVLKEINKRGFSLAPCHKDEYVNQLYKILQKGGNKTSQLADKLLLNALIEARSCERFKLLWKNIRDKELSVFYYELMVSEASHYKIFLSLAKIYQDPIWVQHRWEKWLSEEAEIIKKMTLREDRMH